MQDRVKAPAIALIVVGALNLAFMLFWFVGKGAVLDIFRHMIPPDKFADIEHQARAGGMLAVLSNTLQVCGSVFLVIAGWQMVKLRSHTIAFAGSIVALIPCFTGCCCLLGIPIGIWSLVVLSKPDVKATFTS